MAEANLSGLRLTVVERTIPNTALTGLRLTVVEKPLPPTSLTGLRMTVVERRPAPGSLAVPTASEAPQYIVENDTPYVKFEPETNNKKIYFYPEATGTHEIIALRPNLLDFYEATQTFTGPAQLRVPHFNQVFITPRTLTGTERTKIKNGMLVEALGSGIDIDAGTPNSVVGGLKDPLLV